MKKWKWAAVLVVALILTRAEHTGSSINDLEPVETVLVTIKEGNVVLQTDTGAKGVGNNLEKAIENLHSSASGVVFLDTAQNLLVSSQTEELLVELIRWIRPAAHVCLIREDLDLTEVTGYLRVHPPKVQLKDIRAGERTLQVLYFKEVRGQIAQ